MSFLAAILFLAFPSIILSAAPPSSPYAPTFVKCPSDLAVRPANGQLSSEEQAWRELRLKGVMNSLKSYLPTANIPNFDVNAYLSAVDCSNAPVAGMAISGGGSQSGMTGLGLWQAFDDRYEPAVKAGTGGLTQCLSYLSGLSGGGFNMVLPVASNNFSSLEDIRSASDLTTDYVTGPTGNAKTYVKSLFLNAYSKFGKGFPVSVTDIFGQFFRQYLNPSWAYKDMSDIASSDQAFAMGLAPMPIVLYTEVVPGSSPEIGKIMYPDVNASPTTYEQTPFEFGSWIGGRVQAFFPTKYLGTSMNDGKPANSKKCVNGFDKMTFGQGSTGNAWNFWFIDDFYDVALFYKRDIPIPPGQKNNGQLSLVEAVAETFKQSVNQSMWATYPNPFENINDEMQNVDELLMVDGSENSETIPMRPLIVPERKMDFIIAYDSSTEEPGNGWVNGTTFGRSAIDAGSLGLPFPEVPDATTFVNLGLNQYPTFFGCGASAETPLILYVPNSPWSAYTNYSYTMSEFTNDQLDLVFNNSLNIVSYGQGQITSGGDAPPFPACIACGLIYKSLIRTGQSVPAACQSCFDQHCWNGTTVDTPSDPVFNPELLLDPGVSYKKWNSTVWS